MTHQETSALRLHEATSAHGEAAGLIKLLRGGDRAHLCGSQKESVEHNIYVFLIKTNFKSC